MKKIVAILGVLAFLLIPSVMFADVVNTSALTVQEKLTNPITTNTFSEFVSKVINVIVDVLTPFVVLAFIWSGFLFVRAQGNEERLLEARKVILMTVLGAFILMAAWGFANIIGETVREVTSVQPQ